MTYEEIREPLKKVLRSIYEDRGKLKRSIARSSEIEITVERLEQAIGNHLLDDCPELFGISKQEGHEIRVYFQETGYDGNGFGEYVKILHEEFPEIMDNEDPKYLENINTERVRKGHAPIIL